MKHIVFYLILLFNFSDSFSQPLDHWLIKNEGLKEEFRPLNNQKNTFSIYHNIKNGDSLSFYVAPKTLIFINGKLVHSFTSYSDVNMKISVEKETKNMLEVWNPNKILYPESFIRIKAKKVFKRNDEKVNEPIKRTKNQDFSILLFVFLLLILILLKRYSPSIFILFFTLKLLPKHNVDTINIREIIIAVLLILLNLIVFVFAFEIAIDWYFFAFTGVLYFAFKPFLHLFLGGWLGFREGALLHYLIDITHILRLSYLTLMTYVVLSLSGIDSFVNMPSIGTLSLIIIITALAFSLLSSFQILRKTRVNYIFFYLCTLEILPLLILVRFLK